MRIGVLTGGGDVHPLNIVINTLRKRAKETDNELIGFMKGWDGVLNKKYVSLNNYNNFSNIGGTILKSSRVNLLHEEEGISKANKTLNQLKIDGLIIIGGDDTLTNAYYINHCPCILIAKTIDNDLGYIEEGNEIVNPETIVNYFTLGYPTAAGIIASFASLEEGLRTTAYSHERIIILESMGMHSGWLALASAYGNPDFIIIPEFPLDYDNFCEKLVTLYKSQKHAIIVMAEGARLHNGNFISANYKEKDAFNNPRFGGSSHVLRDMLKKDFKKHFDTRNINAVNPSYLYRSGRPNKLDSTVSEQIAWKSFDLLLNTKVNEPLLLATMLKDESFFINPFPLSFFPKNRQDRFPKRQVDKRFYDRRKYNITENGLNYLKFIIETKYINTFDNNILNRYKL